MAITVDRKFKKQSYSQDEVSKLREQLSLRKIFLNHCISAIPILLIFVVLNSFPFFPHSTYGYGVEHFSSFTEYIYSVGKGLLIIFGFMLFVIVLTTAIDFLRTLLDIYYRFKSVGIFRVTEIDYGDYIKVIRLSDGHKLKIKSYENLYEKVKEQDLVEITRTATKRLLSLRILTE